MLNDDILSVLQGRPIINGMPPLDDFVIIDAKFEPKFDGGPGRNRRPGAGLARLRDP